jgi:hypothetical protein
MVSNRMAGVLTGRLGFVNDKRKIPPLIVTQQDLQVTRQPKLHAIGILSTNLKIMRQRSNQIFSYGASLL